MDVPATLRTKEGTTLAARITLAPLIDNQRVVGAVVTLRIRFCTRALGVLEPSLTEIPDHAPHPDDR